MAMARTYILDASVIVKWFNKEREEWTEEAEDILDAAHQGVHSLATCELAVHETFNVLIRSKGVAGRDLERAVDRFFNLPMRLLRTDIVCTAKAAMIAEDASITFYDAVYLAQAHMCSAPLITANPKHQRSREGIMVIPLDQWFEYKKKALL